MNQLTRPRIALSYQPEDRVLSCSNSGEKLKIRGRVIFLTKLWRSFHTIYFKKKGWFCVMSVKLRAETVDIENSCLPSISSGQISWTKRPSRWTRQLRPVSRQLLAGRACRRKIGVHAFWTASQTRSPSSLASLSLWQSWRWSCVLCETSRLPRRSGRRILFAALRWRTSSCLALQTRTTKNSFKILKWSRHPRKYGLDPQLQHFQP